MSKFWFRKMPRIGEIMFVVRDVIRSVKDAPIRMPIAIESMLPFRAKVLKSFRNFFIFLLLRGFLVIISWFKSLCKEGK